MEDFKLFKFYYVGKVSSFPYNTTFCKVNSNKNIKRKEMKNNYSPQDNKYIFHLLHALHTYLVKCQTHLWLKTQRLLN